MVVALADAIRAGSLGGDLELVLVASDTLQSLVGPAEVPGSVVPFAKRKTERRGT